MPTLIPEFLIQATVNYKMWLHLPCLWGVSVDGVSVPAINSILADAGEKWRASVRPEDYGAIGNILVAQQVVTPTEQASFNSMSSGDSMGGFLPGYGVNSRSDFLERSFSINFLETQVDIEHHFFRPWLIALSINGLVGSYLKADIIVKQYTNKQRLMKGYRFIDAFPTAIEGITLTQDNTDFNIKSVTFGCKNYEQLGESEYRGI